MRITDDLIHFLKDSHKRLNSNIVLTNLEKVILLDSDSEFNHFINQDLSKDLLELIYNWKMQPYSDELFLMLNDNLKQIIHNDNTQYSAQILLPIYHNNKLDGLLIFFRTSLDYIASSIKAPKTTRQFVEIFSADDFRKDF